MKKLITMLSIVVLAATSFGQEIETKYYLDINDGDSLLLKFTYQNYIKSESTVAIHYKAEVFDLDTVLLKSEEVRGNISLTDSIQSESISGVLNALYSVQDSARLKSIMKAVIRKKRRGN